MAKVKGIQGYIEVNSTAGGGGSWVKPGGQRGATLSLSRDDIDVTDKDGSGWPANLSGIRGWEMSMEGLLESGDAGQDIIRDSFFNDTEIQVRFEENGATGQTHTCTNVVVTYELGAAHDDAVTFTATFVPGTDGTLTNTDPA